MENPVWKKEDGTTKIFRVLRSVLAFGFGLFWLVMAGANFVNAQSKLAFLFVCMVGIVFLTYSAYHTAGSFYPTYKEYSRQVKVVLWGTALVFVFSAQFMVAYGLMGTISYDFNSVYNGALELMESGQLSQYYAEYFAQFPNNVFLLLGFQKLFQICSWFHITDYLAVLTMLSLLMVDIGVLFACLCAKKMFGKRVALLSFFIFIPFVLLGRGIVLPYSDTFCMPFVVLVLYCYLCLKQGGKYPYLYVLLMSVFTIIGYLIKPQVVIISIAIVLVELFHRPVCKKRVLFFCKSAGCFLLTAVIILSGWSFYSQMYLGSSISAQLREQKEISFTHYLMMGMNQETGGYFSSEDYAASLSQPTIRERQKYNLKIVQQRLQDMGAWGYAKFLYRKAVSIFKDAHQDMWTREPFRHTDAASKAIQGILYHGNDGYSFYRTIIEGYWVLMLCFMSASALVGRRSCKNTYIAILRLAVMGLVMFLLLFEAGPRYIYHQYLFFVILSSCSVVYELPVWKRNISKWGSRFIKSIGRPEKQKKSCPVNDRGMSSQIYN